MHLPLQTASLPLPLPAIYIESQTCVVCGLVAGQPDAYHSCKLEVWLQAVHVTHRPSCWASISGLLAGAPQDTHAHRVAQATNLLSDVTAQTLAQAQILIKAFMLPAIAVQVSITFLM